MSIMCAVYVPEGIVLSSDSMLTMTQLISREGDKHTFKVNIVGNAQKVFLLSKVRYGICYAGNAFSDGTPMADYMRLFEETQVESSDSVTDVAQKLSEYCTDKSLVFFVAGFERGEPIVHNVQAKQLRRLNINDQGQMIYGTAWNGQREAVDKLIIGQPPAKIDFAHMPIDKAVEFCEFLIDTTVNYEKFKDKLNPNGRHMDTLMLTKDVAFWCKRKNYSK